MIYSIDASALIDLDRWYSYEVFEPLWDDLLICLVDEGRLIASVEVKHEIARKDDFLSNWIIGNCRGMFVESDSGVIYEMTRIVEKYPSIVNPNNPSRNHADPFVIALAVEAPRLFALTCDKPQCAVVTHDGHIQTMCRKFGVKGLKLIDVFRTEGWKFKA